jgi:hypothetical protein
MVTRRNATATPLQLSGEHRRLLPTSWYQGQAVLPHSVFCPTTRQDAHLVRCRVIAVTGKQRLSQHGRDLIVHAAFSSTPDYDISCAADATGDEAEPAFIRSIAHVLNTIFLRTTPKTPYL